MALPLPSLSLSLSRPLSPLAIRGLVAAAGVGRGVRPVATAAQAGGELPQQQNKEQQKEQKEEQEQGVPLGFEERRGSGRGWIGSPHSVSNIRPRTFRVMPGETSEEAALRERKEQVLLWHHLFWQENNFQFSQQKAQFERELGVQKATAEQLSVFYKRYLDENWRRHRDYNRAWIMANFSLVFTELALALTSLPRRISARLASRK